MAIILNLLPIVCLDGRRRNDFYDDLTNITVKILKDTGAENTQLKKENKELLEAVIELDKTVCTFCRRLNPQHKECNLCNDMVWVKELIKNKGENNDKS